ncbi:MAG: D-alanyl-D-alanine carboxypeptidase [Syntrophomonadaceae bacterium]|nr:D-alanyl-D-alanine carboxypeptidase [Syntrophomonadaceae bacterium]HAA08477.1 D-alanyl-D-alanine carboxypeptidase [Syntrophomonas sp.]
MILKLLKTLMIIVFLQLGVGLCSPVIAAPYMSSSYYGLMDGENGQLILSRNANEPRPVASTTKILTAIVVLDYADLSEVATVSEKAAHTPQYAIGLKAGQKLEIRELLKASLVKSANDAAVVLAEHVAGDERFFAHLMNKKAFLLGASQTHFENSSGLPSRDHLSTVYDLALLGRYALTIPEIAELVKSRQIEFRHPSYREPLILNNTNTLLESYPGANGIKTGTTNAAGKCLVASAQRNGRQLIAVTLHAANRQADCARLLDYGFHETRQITILAKEETFKEIPSHGGQLIPIVPERDVVLWIGEGTPNIEKRVYMDYQIKIPVKKGTRVGSVSIFADNKHVESVPLLVGADINSHENKIENWLRNFLSRLKES